MDEYVPIKIETLTEFADQARRLGGTENELSTTEMLDTFGGTVPVKNQDITITESGTYTFEEGYTGFGTVVVECDGEVLPNAEESSFGSSGATEYGIVSDVTLTGGQANSGLIGYSYTYGMQFTPNVEFAFAGFRYCCGDKGSYPTILRLWDDATQAVLQEITVTPAATLEWAEARLDSPINLEVGKKYAVSRYGTYYAYQNAAVTYNTKLTNPTSVYNNAMGYNSYPGKTISTGTYGVDIIIEPVQTESTVTEHKIQTATMNSIANEVIRITGASGTMSTADIITALQGVQAVTAVEE